MGRKKLQYKINCVRKEKPPFGRKGLKLTPKKIPERRSQDIPGILRLGNNIENIHSPTSSLNFTAKIGKGEFSARKKIWCMKLVSDKIWIKRKDVRQNFRFEKKCQAKIYQAKI